LINKSGVVTSSEENEIQETLQIFPNPVSDQLTISNNNTFNAYTLNTIDGKEVLSDSIGAGNTYINMSNLQSGIYFIVLRGDGKQSRTLKIVHL
jgi:hypothetical protein